MRPVLRSFFLRFCQLCVHHRNYCDTRPTVERTLSVADLSRPITGRPKVLSARLELAVVFVPSHWLCVAGSQIVEALASFSGGDFPVEYRPNGPNASPTVMGYLDAA